MQSIANGRREAKRFAAVLNNLYFPLGGRVRELLRQHVRPPTTRRYFPSNRFGRPIRNETINTRANYLHLSNAVKRCRKTVNGARRDPAGKSRLPRSRLTGGHLPRTVIIAIYTSPLPHPRECGARSHISRITAIQL